jgi:hypothetical protein
MMPIQPPADAVEVGVGRLSIADVVRVARDGPRVAPLAPEVTARVQATASWVASTVEQIASSGRGGAGPPPTTVSTPGLAPARDAARSTAGI